MTTGRRAFKVEDIFSHRVLSSLTVTPDGRTAAFGAAQPSLRENKGWSEVWAWSEERGAWPVTSGGEAGQPQFSPRGGCLAFVSDRAGGKPQLYVMDRGLSEGRRVTDFEHGVVRFAWSPDGRRLAVVAKPDRTPDERARDEEGRDWWTVDADERRQALWVVDARGRGAARKVSADGEHVTCVDWTPDGRHLAYMACPLAGFNSQWFESDLKVVGVDGRGRRTVCPVRAILKEPALRVSPDGGTVVFSEGYDERHIFYATAKVIDLKSGERRLVHPRTDLWSISPQWLPDGRVLLEGGVGTTCKFLVCEVGGVPKALDTGPVVAAGAVVARKAGLVFYLGSASQEPDEVYVTTLDGSAGPRRLTDVNRAAGSLKLARSETVTWTSDGMEVEGILYVPTKPGARKPYPLVVLPHGGPYGASVVSYKDAVVPNILCAAGYACLQPNFRGSTSNGRRFMRKIVRDWGDGPFRDIMAGVDALIRRDVADGRRLAVFGASYGGYMATWMVGHTTRFRCAVADAPVTNNMSMHGTGDIPTWEYYSSGKARLSFTDAYWRDQSPICHAHKVKTPILITTGEEDVRVPPGQSHEFYRALKARGADARLVLYPREPHCLYVLGEPRHRQHFFRLALSYINEHVMGRR